MFMTANDMAMQTYGSCKNVQVYVRCHFVRACASKSKKIVHSSQNWSPDGKGLGGTSHHHQLTN